MSTSALHQPRGRSGVVSPGLCLFVIDIDNMPIHGSPKNYSTSLAAGSHGHVWGLVYLPARDSHIT